MSMNGFWPPTLKECEQTWIGFVKVFAPVCYNMIADPGSISAPRVSICIPTYNGKGHLKECLDSVRSQSFQDFEVVICDDQSSDGTLDFARELAQGDERFRFIPNPQRFGLVGNWNNCIALSRGDWIKFVFQDDIIAPTCTLRNF